MPSSSSPLLDFTTPRAPPKVTAFSLCAHAGDTSAAMHAMRAMIAIGRPTIPCMAFSSLAGAVARVWRRAVRVPTAFLPQIAHEIVHIGVPQGVFVCRHARSAIANLFLHSLVRDRLARKQRGTLEKPGELRNVLG